MCNRSIGRYHFRFGDAVGNNYVFGEYLGDSFYGSAFSGWDEDGVNVRILVIPQDLVPEMIKEDHARLLDRVKHYSHSVYDFFRTEKDGLEFFLQITLAPVEVGHWSFLRNRSEFARLNEGVCCRVVYDALSELSCFYQIENPIAFGQLNPENLICWFDDENNYQMLQFMDYSRVVKSGNYRITEAPLGRCGGDFIAPDSRLNMISVQTDIYSVGVLMAYLFFDLFGDDDYNANHPDSFLETMQRRQDYILMSEDMKRILFRALVPDPAVGYRSIGEMMEDVTAWKKSQELKRFFPDVEIPTVDQVTSESVEVSEDGGIINPDTFTEPGCPELHVEFRKWTDEGGGFQDVAGMNEVKRLLMRSLFTIQNPDLAREYRLVPHNGILLYGPPGCGKTYIAQKFAQESRLCYAEVKASDLANMYAHGTTSLIGSLFDCARRNAPCILCLDEIDALVTNRSRFKESPWLAAEVNEFLTQMNSCGKDGVIVIGTTNNPTQIDPAVMRSGRMDRVIYIPLPDIEARKALIKFELRERPLDDGIDLEMLAEQSEGLCSADLACAINDSAMDCALERIKISQEVVARHLSSCRPSVSRKGVQEFERMRDMFSESHVEKKSPRIGFTTSLYAEERA